MESRSATIKRVLLAVLVFVLFYVGAAIALKAIGLDNAHTLVRQAGFFAPGLFIALCASSMVIAPISGSSLYVVGGVLFGHPIAFLLSYIATVLGCTVNFWISRKMGRKVAIRLIGKGHLDELDRFIHQLQGHHSVFYLMLFMSLAQDIVSYAVGLTRVKYSHFAIALFTSALWTIAVYIYVGSNLLELLV